MTKADILVYDTTLRDGAQGEMINFSAEDKLRIAHRLDDMGFHYIEGGWPGSNPKDVRFFELAKSAALKHARLAAFGSTRRPAFVRRHARTAGHPGCPNTGCDHLRQILGPPRQGSPGDDAGGKPGNDPGFRGVPQGPGREIVYDAEHFFDGFKRNRDYALQTVEAAFAAGSDVIVLCDTNGGTLPMR